MTKSDYCSDCPWNYEGVANNLILPRASDLNLCEEQDPDNPDCHRHDEWKEYGPFRDWAMSNGYRSDLTLDRINNNGNYEPSNCRWADMKTQSRNTRFNRMWRGKCAKEWSEVLNISYSRIKHRFEKGFSLEEALEMLVRENEETELLYREMEG